MQSNETERNSAIEAAEEIVGRITLVDGKGQCYTISEADHEWLVGYLVAREHRKTLEAQAKIDLLYKKFKKLDAAIFAVMFYIDKPYPDDARWTPYTRFVGPRMKMLQAAFSGEDIGDLEGMARLQSQLPKKERAE